MVDFAEAGAAVLVFRPVAMVLDREGPDVVHAGLDVGDGVVALVVEDVAGVVAHPHAFVADLADDLCAVGAGGRVAAVLLDDDGDAGVTGDGADGPQACDDALVLAGSRPSEREQEGDAGSRRLRDPLAMRVGGLGLLEEDRREHHDGREAEVASAPREFGGRRGRCIHVERGHALASVVGVRDAPRDVLVADVGDALERALHGERRIRQGHAGELEMRRAAIGPWRRSRRLERRRTRAVRDRRRRHAAGRGHGGHELASVHGRELTTTCRRGAKTATSRSRDLTPETRVLET